MAHFSHLHRLVGAHIAKICCVLVFKGHLIGGSSTDSL